MFRLSSAGSAQSEADKLVILTGAYRVFFPAAGVFAALAIPLWFVAYSGADLGQPTDPYLWHRHEMIFGYLPAALAGFLLTAIPNWTGRKPITGLKLLVLFILWLAARIVIVFDFDRARQYRLGFYWCWRQLRCTRFLGAAIAVTCQSV